MIRVPTIAINRPWASPRVRKQASAPAEATDRLEKEFAQRLLHAQVEREKSDVFSNAVLRARLF